MKGKRFKEEQIIRILQEAEGGLTVASQDHSNLACQKICQLTEHLQICTDYMIRGKF